MRRLWVYLLAVVVLCAGLAMLCIRGRVPSPPLNVTLVAKSLPAQVDVMGGVFTLQSLKRDKSGEVELHCKFTCKGQTKACFIQPEAFELRTTRGRVLPQARCMYASPPTDVMEIEYRAKCMRKERFLSLSLALLRKRAFRNARISFADLRLADLPRTRQCDEWRMSVLRAGVEKFTMPRNAGGVFYTQHLVSGKLCFVVKTRCSYPAGLEGYPNRSDHVSLFDDQGRSHDLLAMCSDGSTYPASTWPQKMLQAHEWYYFEPIDPAPRSITFQVSGCLPPDSRDVVKLEFTHIPVN